MEVSRHKDEGQPRAHDHGHLFGNLTRWTASELFHSGFLFIQDYKFQCPNLYFPLNPDTLNETTCTHQLPPKPLTDRIASAWNSPLSLMFLSY